MTDRQMLIEFGSNLEHIMINRGMKQKTLADKIGVSESTMNCYIKGKRMPSLATVLNMMLALDCDLDDLIFTCSYII